MCIYLYVYLLFFMYIYTCTNHRKKKNDDKTDTKRSATQKKICLRLLYPKSCMNRTQIVLSNCLSVGCRVSVFTDLVPSKIPWMRWLYEWNKHWTTKSQSQMLLCAYWRSGKDFNHDLAWRSRLQNTQLIVYYCHQWQNKSVCAVIEWSQQYEQQKPQSTSTATTTVHIG